MAIKGSLPERNRKEELTKNEFTEMIKKREEEEKAIAARIKEKKAAVIENSQRKETKKQYVIMMRPSVHDAAVAMAKKDNLSFSAWLDQLVEKKVVRKSKFDK